ncbi:MAG: hypothetical protein R3C42_08205 [Parvularculaceae bacterium]
MTSAVIVSVRVEASAQEAFAAFTEDIAIWWRPSALFEITPRGDGELYFEPGPEGRLMTRLAAGKPFEIGRILDWQPGVRLRFFLASGDVSTRSGHRGRGSFRTPGR